MRRRVVLVAAALYMVTAIVWIAGLWDYTFYARDFWFHVVLFLVPAALVVGSAWLILMERIWVRALGAVLALPSLGIWVLSLLLAYSEFRIH